jgi:hypothetical protein
LLTVFALAAPSWSQDQCQYAHVVDPCNKRVVILPVGDFSGAYQVWLHDGPAADYEPRGLALSTLPDFEEFWAYIGQGPYLHRLSYWMSHEDGTITNFDTIDLAAELPFGLSAMEITGLYAADPIMINGETRYLLYAVGNKPGPVPEPWVMIFDQDELSHWPNSSNLLWAAFQIGEIGGTAVDVAVGATTDGGHRQEGFVSVLGADFTHRYYKIILEDGVGPYFALDPWNEEDVLWFDGSEPGSLGLDFDSLGLEAHGVFQTSQVVSDLYTGEASCDLVDDPTDVAIWGPDSWGGYVHFVTGSAGGRTGTLLGYPEGGCPYRRYQPNQIDPDALVRPTEARPLSLALSSDTSASLWLYTANASGSVGAFQISIVANETGASIGVGGTEVVITEGCPSSVAIRDPAYTACVSGGMGDPRPPSCGTPKYCEDNPDAPECIGDLCAKPSPR